VLIYSIIDHDLKSTLFKKACQTLITERKRWKGGLQVPPTYLQFDIGHVVEDYELLYVTKWIDS
jgi:hypothetical protein